MNRCLPRTVALVLAAGALELTLAACGNPEPAADDPGGTSAAAPSSSGISAPEGTATQTDTNPDEGQGSSLESDTAPVLTDPPADATMVISGGERALGEGEFDQTELTIEVGQVVEFKAGDGGTYGVKVGGLDAVTVIGGLMEYYRFDAPGTYPVEEDISGATAIIVVE